MFSDFPTYADKYRPQIREIEVWVPTFCSRSLCNLTEFTCLETILIPYENIFFNLFYLAQIHRNSISNFYFLSHHDSLLQQKLIL